jgi:hypothetical protein
LGVGDAAPTPPWALYNITGIWVVDNYSRIERYTNGDKINPGTGKIKIGLNGGIDQAHVKDGEYGGAHNADVGTGAETFNAAKQYSMQPKSAADYFLYYIDTIDSAQKLVYEVHGTIETGRAGSVDWDEALIITNESKLIVKNHGGSYAISLESASAAQTGGSAGNSIIIVKTGGTLELESGAKLANWTGTSGRLFGTDSGTSKGTAEIWFEAGSIITNATTATTGLPASDTITPAAKYERNSADLAWKAKS